jgi:quercetin dioxygenase-like cupin family protein
MSVDAGECLLEKKSPYDTFVQVIDGKAEIILDGTSHFLSTGEAMTIPAHKSNSINANERFKMILTQIKSGYEN